LGPIFRLLPMAFGLVLSGHSLALGLGELRTQAVLGEPLRLQLELLGDDKTLPDERCFRLVRPANADDLPWLRQGSFRVRPGKPAWLEITAAQYVHEPVMQLAIQVVCGHEVTRSYLVLASPPVRSSIVVEAPVVKSAPAAAAKPAPSPAKPERTESTVSMATKPPPPRSKKSRPLPAAKGLPDRLSLSMPDDDGLPLHFSGQLSPVLGGAPDVAEAQREILRLEFRMLMALHEQATSQLAVAEKLREMESTLAVLQQRSDRATQTLAGTPVAPAAVTPVTAVPSPTKAGPRVELESAPMLGEWGLYGGLAGALLGVLGWLFWRRRHAGWMTEVHFDDEPDVAVNVPSTPVSAARAKSDQDLSQDLSTGALDLHFEAAEHNVSLEVDFPLDGGELSSDLLSPVGTLSESPAVAIEFQAPDNVLPDRPEANPVMELADIMLSFGRVKGAAQALQEYIDNNPQEALQPWIRLMDVYRMAGMREEFEAVARNLNQHFNVAIQAWDDAPPTTPDLSLPLAPELESGTFGRIALPQSLEEMPRIMNVVVEMWPHDDVVGYLYELLRDNRGGQRAGFTLPVVEEILFLVELKETANRLGSEEEEKV